MRAATAAAGAKTEMDTKMEIEMEVPADEDNEKRPEILKEKPQKKDVSLFRFQTLLPSKFSTAF